MNLEIGIARQKFVECRIRIEFRILDVIGKLILSLVSQTCDDMMFYFSELLFCHKSQWMSAFSFLLWLYTTQF